MGGAGGNLAKSYVHQKKGDAHVLYLESNRIFVNRIVGTTNLTYTDVTPVARVMTEYLVWAVRTDSPVQDREGDTREGARPIPASIVFGVGTLPGNDHMNILRAAMAYGIDGKKVQVVAFKSSADATIQLLGGHTPVVSSGLSELLEHARAGKMRLVAISAPSPLPGELASVPTWRSMGVDIAILHWRGLFGPPGMPAEAVEVLGADGRTAHEDRRVEEGARAPSVVRRLRRLGHVPTGPGTGEQAVRRGADRAGDGQGTGQIEGPARGSFLVARDEKRKTGTASTNGTG